MLHLNSWPQISLTTNFIRNIMIFYKCCFEGSFSTNKPKEHFDKSVSKKNILHNLSSFAPFKIFETVGGWGSRVLNFLVKTKTMSCLYGILCHSKHIIFQWFFSRVNTQGPLCLWQCLLYTGGFKLNSGL